MAAENPDRPPLEVFRDAYLRANEAFNRHDFEGAFTGFDPEFSWHTVANVPGPQVFHGERGVIEGFRGLLEEFPNWRVEPQEFIEGGQDTLLVRNVGIGTGRESGVPTRTAFTQLWRFRAGRPVEVREYLDHTEALAAARAA